ncbi:MAG: O-antigen ligase family protein [Bdellovibrio sp.]|nr:O-antigen ligase family protein [Methylotenera sp.]
MIGLLKLGIALKENKLKTIELALLTLMVLALPSIEAPKNIFLVFFVIMALFRQISNKSTSWQFWDWLFLLCIGSAFLSALFAGITPGDEWKGFGVLVTYVSVGWMISRANYTKTEIAWLFWVAVIGVIPPLIWGFCQYLWLHTKHDLQLHSVGHVNHSAIYLAIIFGASVGASLSLWQSVSTKMRITLLALSVFLLIGLFVGDSRGALGVASLMALILITVLSMNAKMKWLAYGVLALTAVLAVSLSSSVVTKQIDLQKKGMILSYRDKVWNVSLEASRFYPVLGIGLDNWKLLKPEDIKKSVEARNKVYNPDDYYFVGHSHNIYLTALVERGYLGLSVLLLLVFAWLRQLVKTFALTRSDATAAYLWAGSFSAWLVTFGVGTVNTTLHHEHGILAFLFLGLYLSYARQHAQSKT